MKFSVSFYDTLKINKNLRINCLYGLCFLLLFASVCFNIHAQTNTEIKDDSQMAQQYVQWIQQAIDEKRWDDAHAAAVRAMDFSTVSSDIPYLLAVIQTRYKDSIRQKTVVDNLNKAIDAKRWVKYREYDALLLKARMLISMREYNDAIICLNQITAPDSRADATMLRLLALRGMAQGKEPGYDYVNATAQFRSQVLLAMDNFPRDPRPLRIFFEYAHNRKPQPSELPQSDINLLELALRRLPFLLEADPELAWMAAPFMREIDDAKRSVSSYRSGSLSKDEKFTPNPACVPVALNLGLIDDKLAIEEVFSAVTDKEPDIKKEIIIGTYKFLRSEEGRDSFTRKLLTFTGSIITDDDNDGYIETIVRYRMGFIDSLVDYLTNNIFKVTVNFDLDNDPESISVFIAKDNSTHDKDLTRRVILQWERYPFVRQAEMENEIFKFGPAVFSYAPVNFIDIGGSDALSGLTYPVPAYQYITLTHRALLSFCSSYTRPSLEIDGAAETIYMDRGVILRVIETLNGRQVSVTEFEKGLPVVQHIDLDADGRMETIRHFRRPPPDYEWESLLDYRRLIASSESDWSGDGTYKTKETYLPDGSVVYSYDMDGGGEMNYSETGNKK
ncbi:tetratricopeptide repeat protein [Treponema sp. R80B11-R83G3]